MTSLTKKSKTKKKFCHCRLQDLCGLEQLSIATSWGTATPDPYPKNFCISISQLYPKISEI